MSTGSKIHVRAAQDACPLQKEVNMQDLSRLSGLPALQPKESTSPRQRGSFLLEAVLATAVLMSFIGLVAVIMQDEGKKQENTLLAAEQKMVIEAAQDFVAERYDEIRSERLFAGDGISTVEIPELVQEGYLPAIFDNGTALSRLFGQNYHLLLRAVDRADTGVPQATLIADDLDVNLDGVVDPVFTDGNPDNREVEIEAVLVTRGTESVPPGRAGDIIARMEMLNAGYVETAGSTSGSYGNFSFDLSEFSPTGLAPDAGGFASVVALSSYGALGGEGPGADSGTIPDPLRRCEGMDPSMAEYSDCLAGNDVYTNIVFNGYDSNGDTVDDVFPALRNLSTVDCMNGSTVADAGEFLVDCNLTRLTGDFIVDGNEIDLGPLTVRDEQVLFSDRQILRREQYTDAGGQNFDETVFTSDRIVAAGINQANGGQDMTEAVFDSRVTTAGDILTKPTCPEYSITGQPMAPRIYLTPAAYADLGGRPVVGVRAFADDYNTVTGMNDPNGDAWKVRLVLYVAQDFCTADVNVDTPLDMNQLVTAGDGWLPDDNSGAAPEVDNGRCSTFNSATGELINDVGDGKADIYEVPASLGAVTIQTRCF